jgi:serine/threonine-protein phosphatase 2A activator
MLPTRAIRSVQDMTKWKNSKAYAEFVNFLKNLSDSVIATKLTDPCETSPMVDKVINILDQLSNWIDQVAPLEQAQRFGNKAFKIWLDKVKENIDQLMKSLSLDESHLEEIGTYFVESFGNEIRIDYGTGHEMTFVMFLMCLFKREALKETDSKSCILRIFQSYLDLVRKLQTVYKMEPAGSHGVWSLDDYQFLSFYFGAAQLIRQARVETQNFTEQDVIDRNQNDYMFFSCLKYITTVKTGPFAEHSNQLWNISNVPTWTKLNSGLLKMYIAEVLEKFPVVQHILFGTLIDISPSI